jgi:hypothetical protein
MLQLCSIVESNFFCIGDQSGMGTSEITFELGFYSCELSKRWSDGSKEARCYDIVDKETNHTSSADRLCQLIIEYNSV